MSWPQTYASLFVRFWILCMSNESTCQGRMLWWHKESQPWRQKHLYHLSWGKWREVGGHPAAGPAEDYVGWERLHLPSLYAYGILVFAWKLPAQYMLHMQTHQESTDDFQRSGWTSMNILYVYTYTCICDIFRVLGRSYNTSEHSK